MSSPSHVVITVHGIRDFGGWQARLEAQLKATKPDTVVYSYQHGWFDVFMFFIPLFFRPRSVRLFRAWLLGIIDRHPDARVDVVAHSFGTHLVGWALLGMPKAERPKLHTVIFAGSVLQSSFRWDELFLADKVQRVLNECGTRDWPLLLSQVAVLFTGMAGRVGFAGAMSDRFRNHFHAGFTHAAYFQGAFMAEQWVPLLTDAGSAPLPAGPDYVPDFWQRCVITLGNHAEPVKLLAYAVLLALVVGLPIWLRVQWAFQQKEAELRQAQLALSAQKADANLLVLAGKLGPVAQLDLLRFLGDGPARYQESHVRGRSVAACADALALLLTINPESQSAGEVKDGLKKAADRLQAQADLTPGGRYILGIARCSIPDRAGFEDLTQAAAEFAAADYPPGRAMCLLHLATTRRAARQFDEAATALETCKPLVPADAPVALRLALVSEEAALFRYSPQHDRTLQSLQRGLELTQDEPLLAAGLHNTLGWAYLDEFETSAARNSFVEGLRRLDELGGRNGPPAGQPLLLHLRHGDITTRRFESAPQAAATEFDRLADDAETILARRDDLTPRQRWELRTRTVNALERSADAVLLLQKPSREELLTAEAAYGKVIAYMQAQAKSVKETWRPVQARCRAKRAIALALLGQGDNARTWLRQAEKVELTEGELPQVGRFLRAAAGFLGDLTPADRPAALRDLTRLAAEMTQADRQRRLLRDEKELHVLMTGFLAGHSDPTTAAQATPELERVLNHYGRPKAGGIPLPYFQKK